MSTRMPVPQAAVIASQDGRVCLVLSRSGKRWVTPKGRIEAGQSAGETALQEAWEEAGILGLLERDPVGSYSYQKCGQSYHVTVFLMHVTGVADSWPEKHRRPRRWVRPRRALLDIEQPGLRRLMSLVLAEAAACVPA
jgi:8-oxo-dGTP pyrophosphatase MutT (NUDIX family)